MQSQIGAVTGSWKNPVDHAHRTWDYFIAAYTFFAVAVCWTLEMNASLEWQYVLGKIALVSLLVMHLGEKKRLENPSGRCCCFCHMGRTFCVDLGEWGHLLV